MLYALGSLGDRDKVNDDAISQLSYQLMALSIRLQEVERRHFVLFVFCHSCDAIGADQQ